MDSAASPIALIPPAYLRAILGYLKTEEREVWDWFSSNTAREDAVETTRLDLLKSTYRVERETQESLYSLAGEVAAKLSFDGPITFYQAQESIGMNAGLVWSSRI